jgi:hypothetical protein
MIDLKTFYEIQWLECSLQKLVFESTLHWRSRQVAVATNIEL